MIAITNLKRQCLCLNKADGRGLHLAPRGTVTVDASEVSGDISRAVLRGVVSMSEVIPPQQIQNETPVEVAQPQRRKRS